MADALGNIFSSRRSRRKKKSKVSCETAKNSFNSAVANFKRKRNKAIAAKKAWQRCKR